MLACVRESYLADGSAGVDDEQAAQGNALLLEEDAVGARDLVVAVREQGDVDAAEASVLAGGRGPREQRVLGVDRRKDDLGTALLKLLGGVRVGNDLGGAGW